jgi:hypothetical protein
MTAKHIVGHLIAVVRIRIVRFAAQKPVHAGNPEVVAWFAERSQPLKAIANAGLVHKDSGKR